jgi:hypothetical protein
MHALRAAQIAFIECLQELSRWPDIPGIQLGVVLTDPKTMATRPLVVRPAQFIGVMEVILAHAKTMLPHGQAIIEQRDRLKRILCEIDQCCLMHDAEIQKELAK